MSSLDLTALIQNLNGNCSIHIVSFSNYVIITNRVTNNVLKCIRIKDAVEAHIDDHINIFANIRFNMNINISKIGVCGHQAIVSASCGDDQNMKRLFLPLAAKLKDHTTVNTDNDHLVEISPYDSINIGYPALNTVLGSLIEKDNEGKPLLGVTLFANTDYLNQIACSYGSNYGDDYKKTFTEFGIIVESKTNPNDIHFIPVG